MRSIKKILLMLLAIGFTYSLYAETTDTRSLDSLYIKGHTSLFKIPDSSLAISERLLNKARSRNNTYYEGVSYLLRGEYFTTYYNYELALLNYFEALNIFKKTNNLSKQADVYSSLGVVCNEQRIFDEAIKYFQLSLKIDSTPSKDIFITKSYLALAHANLGKHLIAEKICEEILIANEKVKDKGIIFIINDVLALIHENNKEYYKAINYLKPSLKHWQKVENQFNLAFTFYDLGRLFLELNQLDTALIYLEKGYLIEKSLDSNFISRNYYSLIAEISKKKGNYKQALKFQNKINKIEREFKNASKYKLITVIKSDFDYRHKIEDEKLENALQKRKLEKSESKQKVYLIIIISILTVSILFGIALIKNRKLNKALKKQKVKIEKQNTALREQSEFKEKLIGIIAHDTRSPLASIAGVLSATQNHFINKGERDKLLDSLSIKTNAALIEAEGMIHWAKAQQQGLVVNKTDVNLGVLINQLIQNLQPFLEAKTIAIEANVEEITIKTDPNLLQIILRNLITNAAKFSKKNTTIEINAHGEPDIFKVTIKDYGVGMDSNQLQNLFKHSIKSKLGTNKEKGFGLGLLQCFEFTTKLGGKIYAESQLGQGSVFTIELPAKG